MVSSKSASVSNASGNRTYCTGFGEHLRWRGVRITKGSWAYRTHITNTLNSFTGTGMEGSKTSANRSRPRPLLVVHSGKTTTGLLAEVRMLSSDFDPSKDSPLVDGVCPREESTFQRETWWKPVIGMRCIAPSLLIAIAAEPVPVCLPVEVFASVCTG